MSTTSRRLSVVIATIATSIALAVPAVASITDHRADDPTHPTTPSGTVSGR